MEDEKQGFLEVEHTADWELRVWAPNLRSLFVQAAVGMCQLAGTVLAPGDRFARKVKLEAPDSEALLVGFLSDLLYWGEIERLGFDEFLIDVKNTSLQGQVLGSRIVSQEKEIKAVTFHQMVILETSLGLEVNIVFDV